MSELPPAWAPYPFDVARHRRDRAGLRADWHRLHRNDAEALPSSDALLDAWIEFHAGQFEQAHRMAMAHGGGAGLALANRAMATHAAYLEPSPSVQRAMYLTIAGRAEAQVQAEPDDARGHFWLAFALGRHAQSLSVTRALAEDLGSRIKVSLERAIELEPLLADAHTALGALHAEVIDKIGKLLGKTQGADPATGVRMFQQALRLNPHSALTRVEFAQGLLALQGPQWAAEAQRLYEEAAALEPADAREELEIERARGELMD